RGSPIRDDWATSAYDAAAGTPLWLKRLGGPNHGGVATAMAMSPDGTMLLVTGSNVVAGNNSDLVTVAYDPATGSRRWIATWDGTGYNEAAVALAVSSDGSKVFVTGSTEVVPYTDDYATVAYVAVAGPRLGA